MVLRGHKWYMKQAVVLYYKMKTMMQITCCAIMHGIVPFPKIVVYVTFKPVRFFY